MNREMAKLRKDPTIPPSAATVTTSTATAFPVSPRLGNAESRANGPRHRTSPKGAGARAASMAAASAASVASVSTTNSASSAATTAASSTTGTTGTATIGGTGLGVGHSSGNTGALASGSSVGLRNGHRQHTSSSSSGMGGGQRRSNNLGNNNTFKFDTNGALWALSASPDFSMVAVVGRDVLKVLSVNENGAEELVNLKTVGIRNNFAGSMDVKWGPTSGRDAKIATIGTNGPIVIWDVGTHNKIDRTIKEHTRSVNRICFSPQDPNLLLSASSDQTVRLWDLRQRDRPGLVMETKDTVREVQFNPVSMNDIVAGYESGNVQRWDLRNLSTSEKKFMAHMGFVTSLDYHPSGRFLATGGRDRTIKVWDMEDEKKREIHTIPTIQYTSKVQWRPHKPYHLAASFKDESTVQVFDFRRPFVPLHILTQHDKDATAVLWKDSDVLWTVSKDKTFASTNIKGQPLSADLLPSGKAAMNCYGQLAFTVSGKGSYDSFEKDLVPWAGKTNAKSVALDGSSEPTIYRTRQTGGVFDCELFNHEAFIYCAQNYLTEAGNVRNACEHNSNIAWQANRFRDSQTWTSLKLFYSDMAESALVVSQVEAASSEATAASKQKDGQVPDEGEENLDDLDMGQSKPTVPSLFAIKVSDAPVKRNWSHDDTIRNLLEYYAEQGDVQMCVTILLVLADEKELPEFSRSQQWFGSYIDLLSRFKLWSVATAVSQACKDPAIHTMNQDSTTIHTACSSCMKPILTRAPSSSGFWACDRCRKVLSSCSVCRKTVRGIFVWCTQCSHGFHLQHAQEWFSQSAECPTGCGHQCFPEMLKVQQEQEQQQQQFYHHHQQTPDDDMAYDSVHYQHPRPLHPHQEQVSYPGHRHSRGGEAQEKGSSPLPFST
ncbi:WD repeat-containing protein 24 [Dissophora globulifera]|uniref:WD repeat-containing protein 24 n=1 Tax=Dissophora globulifera TaxID=979702 RepID=A0A9P6RXU1_9FUNG|nr:WD repeat-containing protein 24 [Dissophora globulifera]